MLPAIIFFSVAICAALSQFFDGAMFYFGVAFVEVATLAIVYSRVDKCWQRKAIKYLLSVSVGVYLLWGLIDTVVYISLINDVFNMEYAPVYNRFEVILIAVTLLITVLELFISLTHVRGVNGLVRRNSVGFFNSDGGVHHSALHGNKESR